MSAAVTIRRATVEDADAIAAVHVAAWEGAYRGIIADEEFDKRTLAVRKQQWPSRLAEPETITLVACGDDGNVVGFAGGNRLDPPQDGFESYLSTMYLDPRVKRQGIGTALLRAIARELLDAGAKNLVLRTLRLGQARAFYETLGARLIPEGSTVDTGFFDDVVYAFDDLKAIAAVAPDRPSTPTDSPNGRR